MKRTFHISWTLAALLIAGGAGLVLERTVAAQGRAQAPQLQVDPLWPKPMGNHWVFGAITGVAVSPDDHVWVVHRGVDSLQTNEKGPTLTPWASECCFAAPQVLEFDTAGTLLSHWGGPGSGYTWPQSPGGIAVDSKGNIWITAAGLPAAPARGGRGAAAGAGAAGAAGARGGAAGAGAGAAGARGGAAAGGGAAGGRGAAAAGGAPAGGGGRGAAPAAASAPPDAHVLKFSKTGQFLLQIGQAGKMEGPDSQTTLNRPKAVAVDDAANEVYVADSGNHRVVVFDATSGAYKRMWGAYGEKPSATAAAAYDPSAPPARQFRDVNCVHIAKDGMVYVCDSPSNRIQVFQKDGKFVKEGFVSKGTLGEVIPGAGGASIATESFGSAWDIAFSNDPQQRFMYVADGQNETAWILQRDSLSVISRFGDGGKYLGRFYSVNSVAVDSKGTVYTGEGTDGKRVQKWLYKGMGAAAALTQ